MRPLAEMFRLLALLAAAAPVQAASMHTLETVRPVAPLMLPAAAIGLSAPLLPPELGATHCAAPVMAGLTHIVESLSAVTPKPPELEAAEKLKSFWNGEPLVEAPMVNVGLTAAELVDKLVVAGTRREFVEKVKAHLRQNIPLAVLRDMEADGYRIEINRRPRQRRKKLDESYDYSGGFNSYGPAGRYIVIAEEIKDRVYQQWRPNEVWVNGVNHEIGHAVAYALGEREAARRVVEHAPVEGQTLWFALKGISEHIDFREAWMRDFNRIPDDLKQKLTAEKRENTFFYFLEPDAKTGWFQRARQETWAEGFDVLLRGSASDFNYARFTQHFPETLAKIRELIERAYGPVFPVR